MQRQDTTRAEDRAEDRGETSVDPSNGTVSGASEFHPNIPQDQLHDEKWRALAEENERLRARCERLIGDTEVLRVNNAQLRQANEDLFSANLRGQRRVRDLHARVWQTDLLIDQLQMWAVQLDRELRIRRVSEGAAEHFGLDPSQFGRRLRRLPLLVHPDDPLAGEGVVGPVPDDAHAASQPDCPIDGEAMRAVFSDVIDGVAIQGREVYSPDQDRVYWMRIVPRPRSSFHDDDRADVSSPDMRGAVDDRRDQVGGEDQAANQRPITALDDPVDDLPDGVVLVLFDLQPIKDYQRPITQWSDIVRQSTDPIFRIDNAGRIRTWNHGAQKLYGYDQSIIGESIGQLFDHHDHLTGSGSAIRDHEAAAVDGGGGTGSPTGSSSRDRVLQRIESLSNDTSKRPEPRPKLRCKGRTAGGGTIQADVSISPFNNGQQRNGAVVIVQDATQQSEAEQTIRENVVRRDEFLAMLSHELRNPLGAIVNAARIIDHGQGDRTEAAGVIIRQSDQMSRLLDDLLDVTRVTLGKLELKRSHFDLRDAIDQSIGVLESQFDQHGLEFQYTACDHPLLLFGDFARIQQVIVNLLRNSIKYTPQGGLVSLAVTRAGGNAGIVVRDTGVGIAPEMQQRVFDMFVQASHTLERSQGGIGLGLTLVRSVVALHRGSVEMHSRGVGHGSEFRVQLPLTQIPAEPVRPAVREINVRRIAVIEDVVDACDMMKSLLQMMGFEVEVARDGLAGYELIRRWRPDLALVDIGLPEIDGYEIARRVRADSETADAYLVALTGYGQASDRQRVIQSGFDGHLVKPLNIDHLQQFLHRSDATESTDSSNAPPQTAAPSNDAMILPSEAPAAARPATSRPTASRPTASRPNA